MSAADGLRPDLPRLIRRLLSEGYTDDEIIDDIDRNETRGLSLRDRRGMTDAVVELRAEHEGTTLDDGPIPTHGTGLTRGEILKARRDWQKAGPPSPWKRAGVSKATYIRHRRKNRLMPWPESYRRRLTP